MHWYTAEVSLNSSPANRGTFTVYIKYMHCKVYAEITLNTVQLTEVHSPYKVDALIGIRCGNPVYGPANRGTFTV